MAPAANPDGWAGITGVLPVQLQEWQRVPRLVVARVHRRDAPEKRASPHQRAHQDKMRILDQTVVDMVRTSAQSLCAEFKD